MLVIVKKYYKIRIRMLVHISIDLLILLKDKKNLQFEHIKKSFQYFFVSHMNWYVSHMNRYRKVKRMKTMR